MQSSGFENGFNHALEREEICIIAIHTDGQAVWFFRQLVRSSRKIFFADFIQSHRSVPVLIVQGQGFQHGWEGCCPHNAGIFAQRVGDDNGLPQAAVCRQSDFIEILRGDERIG